MSLRMVGYDFPLCKLNIKKIHRTPWGPPPHFESHWCSLPMTLQFEKKTYLTHQYLVFCFQVVWNCHVQFLILLNNFLNHVDISFIPQCFWLLDSAWSEGVDCYDSTAQKIVLAAKSTMCILRYRYIDIEYISIMLLYFYSNFHIFGGTPMSTHCYSQRWGCSLKFVNMGLLTLRQQKAGEGVSVYICYKHKW